MYQVVLALLIFHVCLYAHLAEASEGEITFQLTGIHSTWVGFPFGMVQPRDSPTHVEPLEFNGVASNFSSR